MKPPLDRIPPSSSTIAPPPLDVVGPGGTRLSITPQSGLDTVADLSAALGSTRDAPLVIDRRRAEPDALLTTTGLRAGSSIDHSSDSAGASVNDGHGSVDGGLDGRIDGLGRLQVTIETGPDCTASTPVEAGRTVIGRAVTAHLRICDPSVELHHVLIDLPSGAMDERGAFRLTQLSGRVPVLVDGVPLIGTQWIQIPSVVTLGSSGLRFDLPGAPTFADGAGVAGVAGDLRVAPGDPWRRVVHRGPCLGGPVLPTPIVVPSPTAALHRPPATALVGAGVAVCGAGVIAVVMGQMLFALFAVFGAVASVVTWLTGVVSVWRKNRRARRVGQEEDQRFVDDLGRARQSSHAAHILRHRPVAIALSISHALSGDDTRLTVAWSERLTESEAGTPPGGVAEPTVTIGRGTQRWSPLLDATPCDLLMPMIEGIGHLDDVPIPLALGIGEVIGLRGDRIRRDAVARSVIAQMAVYHGPADWELVVVSTTPDEWAWVAWLPQCSSGVLDARDPTELAAGLDRIRAEHQASSGHLVLLVVDDVGSFGTRTGPVRRFIDTVRPVTVALVDAGTIPPTSCRRVLTIGSTGLIDCSADTGDIGESSEIRMCGLSSERAEMLARALAGLIDPEAAHDASRLPTDVSLCDVDDVIAGCGPAESDVSQAATAIARRWSAAGSDPAPSAPLGRSADGLVEIDLVADGPHALIAGTTGSGKSELLRSMVISLALRLSPEHLTFVLVDYKGGSTFDGCADLPHTVGVVTDLDGGLAERALVSLDAELRRREHLLRSRGASDLTEYRRCAGTGPLPRLVVVIDEFAALAKELPDFLSALVGVAQRGRSLGIHLVLATQRPAGVVTDDIRANTNLRLALRLNDASDAHDVVGDVRPSSFGRNVAGRAALRLGPDELVVFQAVRCTGVVAIGDGGLRVQRLVGHAGAGGEADSAVAGEARPESATPIELDVAAAIISRAVQQAGIEPPHRPWLDALTTRLASAEVDLAAGTTDHDGVGVIDDPARQCREVLRWDRALGNLAVIGALGSGTTTALLAVITARCRSAAVDAEHWYVIDGRGDPRIGELVALEHCGAVIGVREAERIHRVLTRLVGEIDHRRDSGPAGPAVSLGIDGLGPLRSALSSLDRASTLEALDRVLAEGPALGINTCWTDDGPTSMVSAQPAESWVFRLDDPTVARSLGVLPIGSDQPGRLRIASCGREAQVSRPAGNQDARRRASDSGSATAGLPGGPNPIDVLPASVSARSLVSGGGQSGLDARAFVMGLAAEDLAPSAIRVPDGDHVFIGGAAGTGKTTALGRFATAWTAQNPQGRIAVIDRRHPVDDLVIERIDGSAHVEPLLITVDDAERIPDPDGRLARIIASNVPGVLVACAARLDAVRAAYGHWTRDIASSRCGLILTSPGELDGDLLGVMLPRRSMIPPRPGLAWAIDGTGHRLIQIALPT